MESSGNQVALKKSEMPHIWLLVQIVHQNTDDSLTSMQSPKYYILHPMDLLESDTSATHAEGFVRFVHNQCLMEGKVIFSSVNRNIVEDKLQKLTIPNLSEANIKTKPKFLLIQYSRNYKDIIQAVISEKDVFWPNGIQPDQRDIVIFDGVQKRPATVLYASENEDHIMVQFQKLKIFCFEEGYDDSVYDDNMTNDAWIFVVYTCGQSDVVFTIINNRETFKQNNNRYKDAVTHVSDGRNVYLAIIIRKSNELNKLLDHLEMVKSSCLILDFPLDININLENALPPPGFQSLCGSVETFAQMSGNECNARLEYDLDELEKCVRKEASDMIDYLEVLENAKKALEQREVILKDSIKLIS